ncbi:MAG: pyridoxal-phosphate dependent enzyme [Sulfitobacter sp.]
MEHFEISPAQRQALLTTLTDVPWPSDNAATPIELLKRCPAANTTPLVSASALAAQIGIASLHIKDERSRMGLGSFKALGAAYVIAHDAEEGLASGQTYVTASAGNHGMSVAAGAAAFGAQAVIYIAKTVPESFAERLRGHGAEVRREGDIYEDSMQTAAEAAEAQGWQLLSDSSWPGYFDRPHRLMEGYLVMMDEAVSQMAGPPSHIFLQAGVGGLAAACATFARKSWGSAPTIIVVEPAFAPALFASAAAGKAQITDGPSSDMGRLDCKEPSLIALKGLARDADIFMTISEAEGAKGSEICAQAGLSSSTSGAAGLAGLLAAAQADACGIGPASQVLCVLSEEAAA